MGWGDVVLQKDASFDVERGEVFAILGGSGCGKSTLLRYLIGLESRSAARSHRGLGAPNLEVGRPPFGVMFQSGALFGSLTVGENVGARARAVDRSAHEAIGAIVRAKLKLVGLDGAETSSRRELSGGMKKRAAIARAMALEPELLFLDEPSAGLDPVSAVELDELILTLNRPRAHGRPRHARAAEHLQDRRALHHARQGSQEHHRQRRPVASCATRAAIRACTTSSIAFRGAADGRRRPITGSSGCSSSSASCSRSAPSWCSARRA